jgi:hypothetical protein
VVATGVYAFNLAAGAPVFTPPPGTYTTAQSVTIATATPGAAIYYTTDGSIPTAASTLYKGAISLNASTTLQAIAIAPGYAPSPVTSGVYVLNLPQADFTITVAPGSLAVDPGASGTVQVTLTPLNGFNSTVNLSCAMWVSGATCAFQPAAVSLAGGQATAQLTVTGGSRLTLAQNRRAPLGLPSAALAFVLLGLGWNRRSRLRLLLLLAALTTGVFSLTACNNFTPLATLPPGPPTATTITVTGTSGVLEHTAPLTFTVN